MHIEHHSLIAEFPEHRDTIHALKQENAHFSRLAGDFEHIDKAVTRIENGEERTDPVTLENMKKQRLAVLDELYGMIRASVPA